MSGEPEAGGPAAYGPAYDAQVPAGGYAWWYLDGISEDGQEAVTIIVFVGSVFSPYYYRARARAASGSGPADPRRHCGINVALYRRETRNWVFTESRGELVEASSEAFVLGGNRMAWQDGTLVVVIDDCTAPWRRPVRGVVRLTPAEPPRSNRWSALELDEQRIHRWLPVAPTAVVEAEFEQPAWSFRGSGYHDTNWGSAPLEDSFRRWNWSRSEHAGTTRVIYDVEARSGAMQRRAWTFVPGSDAVELTGLPRDPIALPRTGWNIGRATRADAGSQPQLIRTLEDSPFYSRSLLSTTIGGHAGLAVHESLDLDRFRRPTTQFMLPFRIRRRA